MDPPGSINRRFQSGSHRGIEALERHRRRGGRHPKLIELDTVELAPGSTRKVSGVAVSAWEADHPSGAPALIFRLELASRTLAYTGDTAWTDAIAAAATDADLLIAEAYFRDKDIPYHLRLADLEAHRDQLTARRVIVTHMSADVLDHRRQLSFEAAHDGLVVRL